MENAKPRDGSKLGAAQEPGSNHHFEYVAIHDQRIALIRSYTVWYFIGLPTSIAVFSFFIYFGLTIGNIQLIALGGIISSLISWVTYSISLSVDKEVVGLYPRIIFLEILLGYDFYREYLRRSPRGDSERSFVEKCENASAETADDLWREVRNNFNLKDFPSQRRMTKHYKRIAIGSVAAYWVTIALIFPLFFGG
ncbi:MAG: hypothetical protein QGF38_03810 [Rhodospirillales bacterium]|jgi:hypothetical protein|nr:hypothetical protein [Rhodospirillales bacterium]